MKHLCDWMKLPGIAATAIAISSGAALSRADVYAGKVLYELSPPAGFSDVTSDQSPQTASAGQFVGWGFSQMGIHAVFWNASGTATDLNPTGYNSTHAEGTNGAQQVGYGFGLGGQQALLWSGTSASAVPLNPVGVASGFAFGIGGGKEVGSGAGPATGGNAHGFLWSGTAISGVDLHPAGFATSSAFGTDGIHQVGAAHVVSGDSVPRAMLWSGTAASAVDLTPTGFTKAQAFGVSGSQQVGNGQTSGGATHALLWTGTAASAVDLNPAGIFASAAAGSNGTKQVGYGDNDAMLWSGTAASAIDLGSVLPANGSWGTSVAFTIDASGKIYGLVDGTYNGNTDDFAVVWSPLLPGDFNRDGHVNSADISAMEGALADLKSFKNANPELSNSQLNYLEDVNGDGTVNNADLQRLLTVLKTGGGTSTPVPEPGTIVLAALGGAVIACRALGRRRESPLTQ
ncbi:MAG TPA: dockerin type I domain-containing protein [Pirellulales bacterium]|jgi:hypothetical protein